MYNKMKYSAKIGSIIFLFSVLITGTFLFFLLSIDLSVHETQGMNAESYVVSSIDVAELIEHRGSITMNPNNLMKMEHYQSFVLKNSMRNFVPIALLFLVTLYVFSVGLYFIFKRMQSQKTLSIAQQVQVATTDAIVVEEPVLAMAYQNLKQKFDDQLDDYKRLHAYLSHEQKNALAILRMNLELNHQQALMKPLDDITDSIDDILTLSEHMDETGLAFVDVTLICAEVFDNYRKLSNHISFYFEEDDHTLILAKARWIYRAVANLLDNAIKYGDGKPITLSIKARHNSVIVMVKDHGIGIEDEKQETIFHDRYRVNELHKNGYGIGLSLVNHVCDLCGGFVSVESIIGEGSCFYLSFPQAT